MFRTQQSALFMTDTLNDVLSIQKIEEGKMELDKSYFSLRDMIERLRSTFKASRSTGSSSKFSIEVVDGVPDVVKGDRFRLEHVVANLLSNAFKFTPVDKGITLHVSVADKDLPPLPAADGPQSAGAVASGVADTTTSATFLIAVIDEGSLLCV